MLKLNCLCSRFGPVLMISAPAVVMFASLAYGQAPQDKTAANPNLPAPTKQAASSKASAYYHYSLGHLYEELAEASGNKSEYVNKAIENYRLTIKEDPSTSFLVEDIAELYRMSGRIREAVQEAQDAIKANPDDLNARRVLARIYTQQIGDAQANRIDEGMVRKALEQYKLISDKDPKDLDSLVMVGRLNRVIENSVDAEAAFKKVLAADPDNEDAVTGLASVYTDRGDAKGASQLLEKLTAKKPSAKAYVTLANNYESMREFALAAEAYKKAIELDPTHTELNQALAQNQALAGKFDDAIATYQAMADADPRQAQPYLGMAQIYREQKNVAKSREMLNKAKTIEPDNLEIRYSEVGLLEDEGKFSEAISTLKGILDATARKTYNPTERSYRSRMLEQLARLYQTGGQYDQAVDSFRQMATLDPDLGSRVEAQIVNTYRLAKDYGKAQAEMDSAVKKYPNDRMLAEVRSQLLSDQGKNDQAIAELKKLLDGKNDREIYLAIADIDQKAKNFPDCEKNLGEAEKLSQTKEDKTAVLFLRGAMYERQKDFEKAEKTFQQVIDSDPSNASALNYLGYMLADRGVRLQEAQELIERAMKLDPNNYAYLDSLGWVYFRQNKLPEAEQQLTHSLQISSKDATIHDHLGDVYFKEGKIKEAILQWQFSLKEWNSGPTSEAEPEDVAKVQKKLDTARVRLAKGQPAKPRSN
jgi:tetratricopeptide (TPR) repeat protein